MKVWDVVKGLQRQTLRTLDKGRKFDILDIKENAVIIRLYSTGNERRIERHRIESAFRELSVRGQISRSGIEARHTPRQPAYVAAIFAEFPGVTYTRDPILLRMSKEQ